MFRFVSILLLAFSLFATSAAQAKRVDAIGVVSRNIYLGADLGPLLSAPPEEFLKVAAATLFAIAQNDFEARAEALADEIAETHPHVIGLQEAFDFTFDLGTGPMNGPSPFLDMLAVFQAALQSRGLKYEVIAQVENINVTVPGVPLPFGMATVGVRDRDVLLVRKNLASQSSPVAFPCSRPSLDGCNFDAVAPLPELIGGFVERGFVGIDVKLRGKHYRVVNTHLEVEEPAPIIQALQAQQLIATLELTPLGDKKLILIGDFNSSPEDMFGGLVTPYQQIVAAGYTDLWDRNLLLALNPEGYTCCQASDLSNAVSQLDERIDLIFVKQGRFVGLGLVIGDQPLGAPAGAPNWASDHAGVYGLLLFKHRPRGRYFRGFGDRD